MEAYRFRRQVKSFMGKGVTQIYCKLVRSGKDWESIISQKIERQNIFIQMILMAVAWKKMQPFAEAPFVPTFLRTIWYYLSET